MAPVLAFAVCNMADRYRRESRDSRDYRDGYSSRSHIGGHSQFSYSGQRRSPSPGVSHQSRRQSPPRTSAPPSIHSMIAHSSTSITLDERLVQFLITACVVLIQTVHAYACNFSISQSPRSAEQNVLVSRLLTHCSRPYLDLRIL